MSEFLFQADEDGSIIIKNLRIEDKEVVDFIGSFKDEDKERKIIEIMEFGVKAVKSFTTENYGRTIDSHFENGISTMKAELANQISDINSRVIKPLTDELKDKVIKDLIQTIDQKKEDIDKKIFENFKKELRDDIFSKFNDTFNQTSKKLEESLLKYVVEERVAEKTPSKGEDFENYVYSLIDKMASHFGDSAQHVGGDKKPGDILVENEAEGIAFAIEVKDKNMTEPAIKDAFTEVERTRKVRFSMLVVNNEGELPGKVGPFRVYEDRRIVVSLSQLGEEDVMPYILKTSYRIMRFLISASRREAKEIDANLLRDKISSVRSAIGSVASLKSKLTKFSNELSSDLEQLKNNIEGEMTAMEDIIK